jgi:hypothetical protein
VVLIFLEKHLLAAPAMGLVDQLRQLIAHLLILVRAQHHIDRLMGSSETTAAAAAAVSTHRRAAGSTSSRRSAMNDAGLGQARWRRPKSVTGGEADCTNMVWRRRMLQVN